MWFMRSCVKFNIASIAAAFEALVCLILTSRLFVGVILACSCCMSKEKLNGEQFVVTGGDWCLPNEFFD